MRVECDDIGVGCSGRVALVPKETRTRRGTGPVFGRAKLAIGGGDAHGVRLKLTGRALRYLRVQRQLRVAARFTTTRRLPAETRTRDESVTLIAPRH
jgi:hypothetical protein